jgi:hypothetical protein
MNKAQTKALAAQLAARVADMAERAAFNWEWDAAHGEAWNPQWSIEHAADLRAVEVWAAPDGLIKARTPKGHYAAYEMLDGAAAEVILDLDAAEMDWRGERRGVAVLRIAEGYNPVP